MVHANGKIKLNVWTAGVATQSSQGPELSGGPQLGESMSDVGMAVGFGVQAAKNTSLTSGVSPGSFFSGARVHLSSVWWN